MSSLLQSELGKLGYELPETELERSSFGKSPREAVVDFQRQYNLEPSGVVDEKTAKHINEAVDELQPEAERFVVEGYREDKDSWNYKDTF